MATALGKDKKSAIREAKTYDFTWEATAPGGSEKKKGEMNAVSANAVRSNLRRMGMMPTVVRKVPQPLFGEKGVKEAQLVVMVRQLSTMINAGVPIVQAFELLISATSGAGWRALSLTGAAGFTLIELMITIAVAAILLSIGMLMILKNRLRGFPRPL